QGRQVEQIARRRAAVELLERVDVDALISARGDEPVQLHGGAVAPDGRVEAELRLAAAGQHVEARHRAVAARDVPLEAEVPDVVAEPLDAHVANLRAVTGDDLDA